MKTKSAKIRYNPATYRWDVIVGRKSVHACVSLSEAQTWCKRNGLSSTAHIVAG